MNIVDIEQNVEYYKNNYNRRCVIANLVYNGDEYSYSMSCCNISCYNCSYYTSFIRRYLK